MMKLFFVTLSIFCIGAAFAADGDLQFAEFEQWRFESGESIANFRIGYRTYGTLNRDRSNTVLMPTWFTGRSEDHFNYEFIGPGKSIDSSRYFVVSVDALSNGVSSSPSNTDEIPFPAISIGDMVDSQHRLLTEVLNIHHLHAVVGISMGGMQTFEWVVRYPTFMNKAVPNTGTPRQTSHDQLLWDTQARTIEALGDSEAAVQIVAGIDGLAGYTPDYVAKNIERDKYAEYMEPFVIENRTRGLRDRVPQLKAMIAHDVSATVEGNLAAAANIIQAEMLIVVSPNDHAVNPIPSREFASASGAKLLEYDGACGHVDSFCGRDWFAPIVREFLAED